MKLKLAVTLAALAAVSALAAACGDPDSNDRDGGDDATNTPISRPSTTPGGGDSPVAATPGPDDQTPRPAVTATPNAVPTVPPGRKLVDAPIDLVEVLTLESFPPQYNLHIVSGLPSGCAEFHSVTMDRADTVINVHVQNTMPSDDDVACTQIYGMHETTLGLGSDFTSGAAYTVNVNDQTTAFTAQ